MDVPGPAGELSFHSPDPRVDRVLSGFVRATRSVLGPRLVSVVLHGGVAFGDLAPGYGDLDFVAVTDGELDDGTCRQLIAARSSLRAGQGVLGAMVEGAFLPRRMLDPSVPGRALWWGTSGERSWDENKLGWFVCKLIRDRGIVLWGEDIRREVPEPAHEDLLNDLLASCEDARVHGQGGSLHSIDWLLTAARSLQWLKIGALSSKSEAADWGRDHAAGEWRTLLPRAKELRLNPSLYECEETRRWAATLTGPIQEAWLEVRAAAKSAERGR
jgi:Aminoglycoside adenylyltransferase, C-terminal domain